MDESNKGRRRVEQRLTNPSDVRVIREMRRKAHLQKQAEQRKEGWLEELIIFGVGMVFFFLFVYYLYYVYTPV